ncbi:hypothetical protein HA402_007274 [Bradysia odoriphaga]|nr:hypothetical protein HA402_007274 [Bradysia odoriphaga]
MHIQNRKPLPVVTVQFGDPRVLGAPSFLPTSGLDFFYGVLSRLSTSTIFVYPYHFKTHQEALPFSQKLLLGLLCCQPQSIEVWSPLIYQIEGPPKVLCFCRAEELHLQVLSPDFVPHQKRIWM